MFYYMQELTGKYLKILLSYLLTFDKENVRNGSLDYLTVCG